MVEAEAVFGEPVHANQREREHGIFAGSFTVMKGRAALSWSGTGMAEKWSASATPGADMAGGQKSSKPGEVRGSPAWGMSQMGAPSSVEDVCGRNREEIDRRRRRSLRTRRRSFWPELEKNGRDLVVAAEEGELRLREALGGLGAASP